MLSRQKPETGYRQVVFKTIISKQPHFSREQEVKNGPNRSPKNLRKQLLPVDASSLLTSYFEIFRKRFVTDPRSFSLESLVTPSGSCNEVMNNLGCEYTVCFEIPGNSHSYIAVIVHSVKNFICNWLGDVFNCYIVFFRSLHQLFKPFEISCPPEVIYKSNEEFGSLYSDQPASVLPEDTGQSHCNDIGMFELNDSNRFE